MPAHLEQLHIIGKAVEQLRLTTKNLLGKGKRSAVPVVRQAMRAVANPVISKLTSVKEANATPLIAGTRASISPFATFWCITNTCKATINAGTVD